MPAHPARPAGPLFPGRNFLHGPWIVVWKRRLAWRAKQTGVSPPKNFHWAFPWWDGPTQNLAKTVRHKAHIATRPGGGPGQLDGQLRDYLKGAKRPPVTKPPAPYVHRKGIDYAWQHVDPMEIRKGGLDFCGRYLSHDQNKNLTPLEAHTLAAHGIDVFVVWETTANRALAGYTAGQLDAHEALIQAKHCGSPADVAIYFAVDFDTNGDPGAVAPYFAGANSVLSVGRTGVYGGIEVVRHLFDHGLIRYGWQTIAWSRGAWEPRAQIRQTGVGVRYAGIDCDLNETTAPLFGQWRPTTTK